MLRAALVAVLAAAVLASCSDGGSEGAATTSGATTTSATTTVATTAGTATTVPSTAGTTVAPTTAAAAGPAVPPGPLEGALLTAADVGDGFFATPAAAEPPPESTPCGAPGVAAAVPPEVRDGVAIGKFLENLQLSQTVYRYADVATAQRALAAGEAGLACGKGTTTLADGTTTTFDLTKLADLSGVGDEAVAYTGTVTTGGQTIRASFVVLRVGRALATVTFLASPEVKDGPAADPILAIVAEKLATVA